MNQTTHLSAFEMIEHHGVVRGEGRRIGIVVSRFNDLITRQLLAGARDCLLRHGVRDDDVEAVWVPGAWELGGPLRLMARSGRFDALIALGCVIRGATPHFDYVAGEAAGAVSSVAAEYDLPVVFGVLTTDTIEQAVERAGTKAGNKGADAALAALEMIGVFEALAGAGEEPGA